MSKLMPSRGNIDYTQHTGAKGGAALGRTRDFMKESDGNDQNVVKRNGADAYKNPNDVENTYGKGGGGQAKGSGAHPVTCKDEGETKVLKTVRPRS